MFFCPKNWINIFLINFKYHMEIVVACKAESAPLKDAKAEIYAME